jgi:ferredoxin
MDACKKLLVYYFSGTGNSKNVAHWLCDYAHRKNMEVCMADISKSERRGLEMPDPEALVAFVSPVHGFNYPPIMMNFIMHFPKGKNKVLLLNTRAGMQIGNWVTPGVSGIAFYFSALLLKFKGYSIQAMFPVDLPSNWISLHPALNSKTVRYLHLKNKERVIAFASNVLSGKSHFKSLREIFQDILVAPISVLYYFAGRFVLAKTFYASKDCNNCGLCIKKCPVQAIKKIDNRPYWTFNCESCMKCMCHCPEKAIETAHGFIAGFFILMSTVTIGFFYRYFEQFFFEIEKGLISNMIEILVYLGFLWASYLIVHYLMHFRIFERLMVYTSLTRLKFWRRRYKALKHNEKYE